MSKARRSDLIIGIILLLIGGWFLAAQLNYVPSLNELIDLQYQLPLLVVAIGVFLFLLGLILRTPGLCIPACIVGGIGGLLYWTNSYGNWADWAYLWTLIPGFVGIGIILSTLLGSEDKNGYLVGIRLLLISGILFALFYLIISGQDYFMKYWPILVILAGVWIIISTIFRRK